MLGEKDLEIIKKVMGEVIEAKKGDFWVEREEHYQHHLFLNDMMKFMDRFKSTFMQTLVRVAVVGVVGLMVLGFGLWMNKQ